MDAPQTPDILTTLGDYWKLIVGFMTGLGVTLAFYRKYCRGRYKAFVIWRTAFIALPTTLERIESDLQFGPNVSLKQKLGFMAGDIASLGQIISNEIANRRSALQFATTPLFEFDINGKLVWANDALLDMTECELHEVVGSNWRNIISGQHRVSVMAGWESAVADGTNYRTKFKLVTEALECWVVFNVACNKDYEGKVLGWLGKLRKIDDPTEMHKTGESPTFAK